MSEHAQRRDLKAEYKDARPDAGVYRIADAVDGTTIIGPSPNLKSVPNRLDFARSTNSPGALAPKTKAAVQQHGFEAISFEVLERLDAPAEASPASLRDDLATLEQLWREKLIAEAL